MRYGKDEDFHLILCSNLEDAHGSGSLVMTAACGCDVWVSPPGYAAHMDRRQATELVCMRHGPSSVNKDFHSNRETPALKGVRRQLTKDFGIFGANRIVQRHNVRENEGD